MVNVYQLMRFNCVNYKFCFQKLLFRLKKTAMYSNVWFKVDNIKHRELISIERMFHTRCWCRRAGFESRLGRHYALLYCGYNSEPNLLCELDSGFRKGKFYSVISKFSDVWVKLFYDIHYQTNIYPFPFTVWMQCQYNF